MWIIPDFIGGLVITQDVRNTPNHTFFNKSAFVSEGTSVTTANGGLGVQGTSNVRFFHGPGINNFDLGVQKSTRLRENISFLIRAEFFNAFEHAQFNSPSGSFTSSDFRPGYQRALGGTYRPDEREVHLVARVEQATSHFSNRGQATQSPFRNWGLRSLSPNFRSARYRCDAAFAGFSRGGTRLNGSIFTGIARSTNPASISSQV